VHPISAGSAADTIMNYRNLLPLAALLAVAPAASQSLTSRVLRNDGNVRLSFQPKPGVCGDGAATIYIRDEGGRQRVQVQGNNWNYSTRYNDEWDSRCEPGPVRVALTVEDGRVISLRNYVGGEWRGRSGAVDLGTVDSREAADMLVQIAERSSSTVARDALFAATIADGAQISRQLLRLARNSSANREVRKQAVFWLGQEAAAAATAGLREIIDSDEDLELREHAIFALSQRPAEESVPALISLVRRNNVDPRLKKRALFWLAQKDDPRAIALFEEILIK
jgi:hypothetical protein